MQINEDKPNTQNFKEKPFSKERETQKKFKY